VDALEPSEYDELVQATEADAKRERVQAQMSQIVNTFGQVTQIASNLGIDVPGLNEAATIAGTANTVINDVMGGDYVGALVGVTGLFGHRPDPEALFRQQLMHYLDENFRAVNAKLDTLIKGQQQLMAALSSLSNQLSTYDSLMHSHLDRIEFKVDTIQELARQQFYLPFGYCHKVEQNVRNVLKSNGYPTADLRSFDQMSYLLTDAGETFQTVHGCIDFLDLTFKLTIDKTPFQFTPLAVRYSSTYADPTYIVDKQKVGDFTTSTQAYIDGQYAPTMRYVLSGIGSPLKNVGVTGTFNKARLLAAGAVPTTNVSSLLSKLSTFTAGSPSCGKGTVLSDPLINVLCSTDNSSAAFLDLPPTPMLQVESDSEGKAEAALQVPLVLDALEQLSTWAEFFAPAWDYADEAHTQFFTEASAFLAQKHAQPKGLILIKGALRVDTLGLAQMNLLYGDVPAALAFNDLWDDKTGLQASGNALTGRQAAAASLLASGNPYLARNVLMLALDKSRAGKTSGFDLSYEFALNYMRLAKSDPDAQLKTLFQNQIVFKNVWKANDSAKPDSSCSDLPNDGERLKSCTLTAVATVAGVDVPLPSPLQFSNRTLVYPDRLLHLVQKRDGLAALAAEYEAFSYAGSGEGGEARSLGQSLLQIVN
jgi:hypothetical protein